MLLPLPKSSELTLEYLLYFVVGVYFAYKLRVETTNAEYKQPIMGLAIGIIIGSMMHFAKQYL